MKTKKTYLRLLIIIGSIILLADFLYEILGPFYYDYKIEANFGSSQKALSEIEKFVKAKYPINISFEYSPRINLVVWVPSKEGKKYIKLWDVALNDSRFIETIAAIGWSQNEVLELNRLLEAADCVSVQFYAPKVPKGVKDIDRGVVIVFRRNALGSWHYLVFPNPLSREQMEIEPTDYKKIKMLGDRVGWSKPL